MQLLRLRLANFRQHADADLEFGPGITGIIGPNGSGKTSILEAIAWALYGVQAVRGDKDSIRRLRAKGRAGVEVDLEFRLGVHEYRVRRGLSTAVLHQDGQVIVNWLKEVIDKLERSPGMTHDEFFHTYFTGQKQLAEMAARGRTGRAAEDALGRAEPRWNAWMGRRQRTLSLDGERRMAEQAVVSSRQEFQRLDKELADALAAREQLRALGAELAPVARLKQEVAALE